MGVDRIWPSIREVVLDWNGTLINDLELAVESVNYVCGQHGMPSIDKDQYRARFQFPVASFYQALGFDLEVVPLPVIISGYLESFNANIRRCPLQRGALTFIKRVHASGRGLSILSASRVEILRETLESKGLVEYLNNVCGLDDEYAVSKLAEARRLQTRLSTPPTSVLYVGDTTHDVDVGAAIGWHTILMSCGHQHEKEPAASVLGRAANFDQLLAMLDKARPSTL